MSNYEGQSLLAQGSWNSPIRLFAGALVGCAAILAVASTAQSSLYAAPVVTETHLSAAVQQQTNPTMLRSPVAMAAMVNEESSNVEVSQNFQPVFAWGSLAAVASVPLAILGAAFAFRSKKAAPLDPIDMLHTSGTQWAMVASAGESAVARNYANALIELGQEGNCLEQLHTDVDNFATILSDDVFSGFFTNQMMVGDKQKEIIAKLCEESQMSQITKNFLCFLVDQRRIAQLPGIIKEFDEQFYEVSGTQVATVTAAVPLTEEQLRMIANKLHEMTKGKNIKIKSQVNPDLLAGFVLEYGKSGSQRIDLSLRGQLNELENEMKEGIRTVLTAGVPAGVQLAAAALGVNALLAGNANAGGNIFDFGLTMPVQMIQFLLLMVFLEKTVFTPVGKIIDERAEYIKKRNSMGSDNSKEIAALNAQAEQLLDAARKDAAKELEKAKKEANAQGAEKLGKAKADMESSLKKSLSEIQKSKDDLWNKLEEEVLPALAEDIVNKLLQEEPQAASAAKQ